MEDRIELSQTLHDMQSRLTAVEQELRHTSENLCGVKVEGEVTLDVVYAFVEGQIEKQSNRADKAEARVKELEATRITATEAMLLRKEVETLHAASDQLRWELERAKLINKDACLDWSHDDSKVKELLKPHLPGDDLESDGYGFRGVIAVAELAAARFTALENALREAREALSKCANEETYHEYYRLTATKALQTLSALNIK